MKKEFRHGAVLLLEDDETRENLMQKCMGMRQLGMNTAVIWPPCFYRHGKREYSIQRQLLDCAQKAGLKVIVELTGQVSNLEYLPDCEWKDEYAVLNQDGSPARMQNGLGETNYNHPVVKKILAGFFEEAVNVFKKHPALLAWDIWNETHFKTYDPFTIREYQRWLKKKYGNIGKLNSSWKKSYTAFSQIHLDPITWASIVSSCDWEEFRTDNLSEIAVEWAEIVRKLDPKHPVIADNVMSNAVWSEFDRGTDDWKLAEHLDIFGLSFYPKTGGRLLKVNEPWLRRLTFSGAYSAGKGKFMISEMQSHCYSEIFTAERVSPDELLDWNLESLFEGSSGTIYWKWEPFKAGFQLGGRGLVLADGTFSKRAKAVADFSNLLEENPDMGKLIPARKAALLYDRTSNFTVQAINNRIRGIIGDDQPAQARFGVAKTACERNVPLGVVTPEQMIKTGLPGIDLLFLPYQLVMDQALTDALEKFMKRGGIAAASWPCGDISPDDRLYEQVPGGPLGKFFHARQTDNLEDSFGGEPIEIQELEMLSGKTKVLLRSDAGRPLLLKTVYGKGAFYYFAAALWNNVFAKGARKCANAYWDALGDFAPIAANLPIQFASGEKDDYILISNPGNVPECVIKTNRSAELIFGRGTLQRKGGILKIQSPRHAVLKLKRG